VALQPDGMKRPVENAKKSSTAMSTGQVKSGNLFHAINETAQEN
jgi:hypothetical protein